MCLWLLYKKAFLYIVSKEHETPSSINPIVMVFKVKYCYISVYLLEKCLSIHKWERRKEEGKKNERKKKK